MRGPHGDENVLYLDCINANILTFILYYSLLDITIRGNWVRVHHVSFLFLRTTGESTINSKLKA